MEFRGTASPSHISVIRTSATVEQSRCSYLSASAKPKGKRESSIREGGESRKVGDTDEKYSCKIPARVSWFVWTRFVYLVRVSQSEMSVNKRHNAEAEGLREPEAP